MLKEPQQLFWQEQMQRDKDNNLMFVIRAGSIYCIDKMNNTQADSAKDFDRVISTYNLVVYS